MHNSLGSAIILTAIMLLPIALVFTFFLRNNRRLTEEIGKQPFFQARCSIRLNGSLYNFARVTLYEELIVFVTFFKYAIVPTNAIQSVKKPLIRDQRVFIETNNPALYPSIVIESTEAEPIHEAIESKLRKNIR